MEILGEDDKTRVAAFLADHQKLCKKYSLCLRAQITVGKNSELFLNLGIFPFAEEPEVTTVPQPVPEPVQTDCLNDPGNCLNDSPVVEPAKTE